MHNTLISYDGAFIYQTHLNYTIGRISLKINNLSYSMHYFFNISIMNTVCWNVESELV